MTVSDLRPPTPAWRVVRLLWSAARRRAIGRARRQQEIVGRRRAGSGDLGSLTRLLTVLVVCGMHGLLGWFVSHFAQYAATLDAQNAGRIAIAADGWHYLEEFAARHNELAARKREMATMVHPRFEDRKAVGAAESARSNALAQLISHALGQKDERSSSVRRMTIERQFLEHGEAGFVPVRSALETQLFEARERPVPAVPVFTLLLAGWLGMLVCQGEGLELDVQRRRHPMWEWLLSHPVRPAHAFYAELLAPLMANPVYFAAPIFLWVILGHLHGIGLGLLAALLIGLPVAIVTSGLNKSIETLAMLRLGVRSRGAVLGVISWLGYVAMLLPFFTLHSDGLKDGLLHVGGWLSPWFPVWPLQTLTIGWAGTRNLAVTVASWWLLLGALGVLALWVTHRATARGLHAPAAGTDSVGTALLPARSWLGSDPLRRKEFLWLLRDRGAIVQIVLIPLTIAATQAFQFQGIYHLSTTNWTALCGLAIICGTYFLLVLGPRSLASEGGALWLALTWPRGLEDLLKAKARLWRRVADCIVGAVLLTTGILFPAAWWKIGLVGIGWLLFSSTLALKSVSLVTPPSASGEPEPPNRALRWIALIGTLAFGTGVATASWHVAIIGIVFSSLIAVAMWQGLRAKLPYLFDPWSQRPVPAPSLLHASVGTALVVEFTAIAIAIAYTLGGPSSLWIARAVGYGLAGALGCLAVQSFLSERGVRLADIVRWSGCRSRFSVPAGMAVAIVAGVGLALFAAGYLNLLRFVPAARESLEEAARIGATFKNQQFWIVLLAVGFAPPAEEYLFRGLLFRALDREFGDWRALVLSAAFFAVFHPPIAWIPVGCLGVLTAWLFRETRHLLPCVACHMVYNAGVVVLGQLGR